MRGEEGDGREDVCFLSVFVLDGRMRGGEGKGRREARRMREGS